MRGAVIGRLCLALPWALMLLMLADIDSGRRPRETPLPLSPAANLSLPTIYAITPTYSRPVQKAELTRLANTFRQLPSFHWVLVEDAAGRSRLVSELLAASGLPSYTLLYVPTPRRYKRAGLPRATEQRNEGLRWVRKNRSSHTAGVVFFADDDNTYSLELFHEVGFAVNLKVILSNPKAVFKRGGSQPGMQESDFLKQITTVHELEPKAANCTKVLVWHTRTEKANLVFEPKQNQDVIHIEV
ncbi:galactosylgalactosylxylosylprotein 3-beta-glucuronosyltransferase 2 isoform X2 [Leucoraja erinacea]|uniref:galactosylgalactosylxylosylprotein 3-beta-glucuronosyltransferase 2 isoform X2 n=1 Tax=Leucoraja erinaceus TaxID=7782 RepID=UPI002456114E|nr:galactosylgalactosylxylosylprotein 3-beta-glucuronosyltransferase 2 isoform X2 [Leucoraja erinacea]